MKEKFSCHIILEETPELSPVNVFTKRTDNLNARLLYFESTENRFTGKQVGTRLPIYNLTM